MSDAALTTRPGAFAQVRVREPAGERTLDAPLTIGGEGAQVVVPGLAPGDALQIARREGVWFVERLAGVSARFDGRPLQEARDLRRGDVLTVGDAQVVVTELTRTLLRLDVIHLVGNDTIAPVDAVATLSADVDEEVVEIRAISPVLRSPTATGTTAAPQVAARAASAARPRRTWHLWPIAAALILIAVFVLMTLLEPVALDLQPEGARVRTPGTLLSVHAGDQLFVLPGAHVVRAELDGYVPAQTNVVVTRGEQQATVKLRLEKLPGRLIIDTGGVAAEVSVDGVEVGKAPGEIDVPAGVRTVTLRAPRYLDHVSTLTIEGAGVKQELKAQLQPSWGTLSVQSIPANAQLSIDGKVVGNAPMSVEVDAGVRRVELSAPGLKTWQSNVVVKAGETLELGPITLGQPDAKLTVRSTPSGAEVAVGSAFRGRTPVTVDLSPGMSHDIVLSLPGYASWTRSVFADAGKSLTLDARLEPELAGVSVRGEPADAEIFVDGKPSGRAPQTLKLTTTEHRLEVRKEGFKPFVTTVVPAKGLERDVRYKLTSADPAQALQESAPIIKAKTGYELRLVPPGTFTMGSDRREQGRRPNETQIRVTLKRPFYIGTYEVTNADFRRFRPEHKSGYVGKQTFELDNHPVTRVTWEDAAAYANWLSEQDGLVPAYQQQGNTFVLKKPVTTGYRLPTEAEWEYAARYAGPNQFRRFAWGDALPVVAGVGNVAGEEASESMTAVLEGYRDEYLYIAPVGKFAPSPLGLHDMSGNVSEWVNDYYLSFVDNSPVTDPLGPENGTRHVIRGANWQTALMTQLRLAWRDGATESSQTIGFRLARYADLPE